MHSVITVCIVLINPQYKLVVVIFKYRIYQHPAVMEFLHPSGPSVVLCISYTSNPYICLL